MSEKEPGSLAPLTPEDFNAMMGETPGSKPRVLKLPFALDLMVTRPDSEAEQPLHCGIFTGEDGSEDEYPPNFNPSKANGSVESLQ